MNICGPHRVATGLLKTKEVKNPKQNKLLTWDAVEGEIVFYTPEGCKKHSNKTIYTKKTYKASDFKTINISIVAGDVINMGAETWEDS